MCTYDPGRRPAARACAWRGFCVVYSLLVLPTVGLAQVSANQSGRMLDANPQVGGSRYNAPVGRPLSPLVGGNALATGNVGRGFSLRSSSPILAPTAFRAQLGSSTLSSFRRDSIGVDRAGDPYAALTPWAYFDPSSTAPTASYLRGDYDSAGAFSTPVLGAGEARRSGPSAFDPFSPYGTPPAFRAYSPDTGSLPDGLPSVANPQLSSSIFGVQRPSLPGPLGESATRGTPGSTYLPEGGATGAWPGLDQQQRIDAGGPMDMRIGSQSGSLAEIPPSPFEIFEQPNAADAILSRDRGGGAFAPFDPVQAIGARDQTTPPVMGLPGPSAPADVESMLGRDLFTDMRLALELIEDPQADWFQEMLGGEAAELPTTPTESIDTQLRSAQVAEEFLGRLLESDIRTFVTEGPAPVNEVMRRAEAQMDQGRYYDAAQVYRQAQALDPVNPLPVLGEAHALLAAGEYLTAAHSLIRGLERFPDLVRFRIDLRVLLGGAEVVDIRRADLMRQLAHNENTQLRFLLGYLELHSGLREFGRANIERAAQDAEFGSIIRRFPDLLRRAGILTPAVPPADTPPPVPGQPAPSDTESNQSLGASEGEQG